MSGRLDGKVALVTRDPGTLALAVTAALAREGARVVLGGRGDDEAPAQQGGAGFVTLDPASSTRCERALDELAARYGRLDILCNLASAEPALKPLHEVGEDEWHEAIVRTVKSVLLVSRYAVPVMRRTGGSIVNLSHSAALVGVPGTTLLAATTGALLNMTRAMALMGKPDGIRVNCLYVGSTYRPVVPSLAAEHQAHPVRAEDVAATFVYLASDESRHMTGQILGVDDGLVAWR